MSPNASTAHVVARQFVDSAPFHCVMQPPQRNNFGYSLEFPPANLLSLRKDLFMPCQQMVQLRGPCLATHPVFIAATVQFIEGKSQPACGLGWSGVAVLERRTARKWEPQWLLRKVC